MSQTVSLPGNGSTASGHLALPASGRGPGVLVLQEWWGLDSGIREVTDRLGASHNALGTYDAARAAEIWPQAVAFLHEQLA
jgi:hypothetical protein